MTEIAVQTYRRVADLVQHGEIHQARMLHSDADSN